VIDPDGSLRIIDLAREVALEDPSLAALVQAAKIRDETRAAADAALAPPVPRRGVRG
jgi:hypothetical protein